MIQIVVPAVLASIALYERSERVAAADKYERGLREKQQRLQEFKAEIEQLSDQVDCLINPNIEA